MPIQSINNRRDLVRNLFYAGHLFKSGSYTVVFLNSIQCHKIFFFFKTFLTICWLLKHTIGQNPRNPEKFSVFADFLLQTFLRWLCLFWNLIATDRCNWLRTSSSQKLQLIEKSIWLRLLLQSLHQFKAQQKKSKSSLSWNQSEIERPWIGCWWQLMRAIGYSQQVAENRQF